MSGSPGATRCLLALAGAALASELAYRRSFLLEVSGRFLVTGLELVAVLFLFERIPDIAGWTRWEVVTLYGAASLSLGLAELLCSGLDAMPELVRDGELDRLLIRPLPALGQVVARRIRLLHVGRVAQGALALGLASSRLPLAWDPVRAGALGLAVGSTTLVFCALFLAGAASCFWTTDASEAANAFTYGGVQMTQFPLPIYRPWLRLLFLYVIPVGFVSYYPLLIVLGRRDALGLPPWTAALSAPVAVAFAGLSLRLWSAGLRRYQSTGS